MNKELKYSVLRYYPSRVSGECINLGILFSEETIGYQSFYYSKNLSRISKFDDEIKSRVLKSFLGGIEYDIDNSYSSDIPFDIHEFIKFYINEYEFDEPKCVQYDSLEEIIESLKKTYFRFDYQIKDRPTKAMDREIIEKLIISSGRSINKEKDVEGKYSEKIHYDLITDDYYIKIFDFDGKNLKRCINTAKLWAWNSRYEGEKKVIVIYRYSAKDPQKSKEFGIITQIFNDSKAGFYSIDESARILQKVVNE